MGSARSRWLCTAEISMAAFLELAHDRVDLVLSQHEIAHDHGLGAHRLERDPAAQCKAWPECDAVERHFEVGAWEANAIHAAGLHAAGFAERLSTWFQSGSAAKAGAARMVAAINGVTKRVIGRMAILLNRASR